MRERVYVCIRERERDRQTDRQTDKQTDTDTDTDRKTYKQKQTDSLKIYIIIH